MSTSAYKYREPMRDADYQRIRGTANIATGGKPEIFRMNNDAGVRIAEHIRSLIEDEMSALNLSDLGHEFQVRALIVEALNYHLFEWATSRRIHIAAVQTALHLTAQATANGIVDGTKQ